MTKASVGLYDTGERNGGRPACEGAKTPCSTLEKFKSVKSAQVAVKWEPVLMQQRTMLDLGDDMGSFIERYEGVCIVFTSRALSNVPTFKISENLEHDYSYYQSQYAKTE